jgi:hypothetical protein
MRIAKFLALGVAAIVVLLVIAVAIVASTFDPNDYKGVAANAFTARTGRTLQVNEELHPHVLPVARPRDRRRHDRQRTRVRRRGATVRDGTDASLRA